MTQTTVEGEISLKLVEALTKHLILRNIVAPHDLETIIAGLRYEASAQSSSVAGSAADVARDWLLAIEDIPIRRAAKQENALSQSDD